MRKILIILAVFTLTTGCNNEKTSTEENLEANSIAVETESTNFKYDSYGESITSENALSNDEMMKKFQNLKSGDTIAVKFNSKVIEVCQKKGCWMNLNMGEEEVMVRFKDYAFFMPKDIAGSDIIVQGRAYIEEMSIADQRHYAEDAKKSETEIAAIIAPKQTWTFEASGVLIQEKIEQ